MAQETVQAQGWGEAGQGEYGLPAFMGAHIPWDVRLPEELPDLGTFAIRYPQGGQGHAAGLLNEASELLQSAYMVLEHAVEHAPTREEARRLRDVRELVAGLHASALTLVNLVGNPEAL